MKSLILGSLFAWGISAQAATTQLTLELEGLGSMKGQHYEGWNIVDGEALSTGRFIISNKNTIFAVNAKGKKLKKIGANGTAHFDVAQSHLKSSTFVLTIEPNFDKDAGPSSVHIMGGSYSKRSTDLSIAHGSSLKTDFSDAKASYILAAPTGGEFNQGMWFLDPSRGESSLELPDLPTGWVYEGWIVNTKNDKKFSTGLFNSSTKIDSDGAGLFAGPLKLDFPSVPGQDIVTSGVTLNDGKHAIVVTVEPYPDFDPAPSAIKILKADVSKSAPAMSSLNLQNISKTAPTGKAHIH